MQKNLPSDCGDAVVAQGFVNWPVAAITAGTPLAEVPVDMQGTNVGLNVGSMYLLPNAALTASNSAYATITVAKRTAGGSPTTIASVTTQITGSGNWTAFKPVPLNVVAGAFLAAGDVVTVTVAHTGGGVNVPASQLVGFQAAA